MHTYNLVIEFNIWNNNYIGRTKNKDDNMQANAVSAFSTIAQCMRNITVVDYNISRCCPMREILGNSGYEYSATLCAKCMYHDTVKAISLADAIKKCSDAIFKETLLPFSGFRRVPEYITIGNVVLEGTIEDKQEQILKQDVTEFVKKRMIHNTIKFRRKKGAKS